MNEIMQTILEKRSRERAITTEVRKLQSEERTLSDTIQFDESQVESRIEEAKQKYIDEQTEEIRGSKQPLINSAKESIETIKAIMASEDVDETEELAAARQRKEYLDEAALFVEEYYNELKNVSTPYFIDIAYTEAKFNATNFKKAFKDLPKRLELIKAYGTKEYPRPFSSFTHGKNLTRDTYLMATLGAVVVASTIPSRMKEAVARAHFLHESSKLYHRLMRTLIAFRSKTDEVVNELFQELLTTKRQRMMLDLERAEIELEKLEYELRKACDAIEFNEESIRRSTSMVTATNKSKLNDIHDKLEQLENDLEDLRESLTKLQEQHESILSAERDLYLKGREDREVVLPTELLYEYNKTSNSKIEFKPGLYLYTDLATVGDFIQLTLFQIRNIMAWGAVQFKVLDLLNADYVAPLMLRLDGKAKNQDINVSSLREDREKTINLMHDFLERRRVQILSVTNDIGSYNALQKENGSATVAYQIIYIVLNEAIKLDEKLIQLIHNGEKLGILVLIFVKEEFLDIQTAKTIEPYFKTFVELSPTGLSSYTPQHYLELLIQAEDDKK